jgi:hypothetical protein
VTAGAAVSVERESIDVTYDDGGVEETLVIRFADDAYTPAEAWKLAEALVELANYAEGLR